MVEFKNNYLFAGVLLAFALIVGGTTYSLVPTGNYKVCDNGVGWQLQDDGQYSCGDRKYDCYQVRSTKTGKSNYYCDEAARVEIQTEVEVQTIKESCEPIVKDTICPDFISYTDTGKTYCRRHTDGTETCSQEWPY